MNYNNQPSQQPPYPNQQPNQNPIAPPPPQQWQPYPQQQQQYRPQPPQMEVMTRTYKGPSDFQHDQKKLAKQGWTVQSTMSHQPRRSVGGLVFVPFGALRPPKPVIMVTYQRVFYP